MKLQWESLIGSRDMEAPGYRIEETATGFKAYAEICLGSADSKGIAELVGVCQDHCDANLVLVSCSALIEVLDFYKTACENSNKKMQDESTRSWPWVEAYDEDYRLCREAVEKAED